MTVLIIEDEARAARELAAMVTDADESITVTAILESVEQALPWFAQNPPPDLILSDIQLADGLSFDIFRQIKITSPVIFCTAFDEYLMNAFDTNAVSYLLKPITREKLHRGLDKFYQLQEAFSKEEYPQAMDQLLQQLKPAYKTALLVHQQEKIIPVPVKEVAFFYLDKTLVQLTTTSLHKYHITGSLDELEKMLDPAQFYRANRQYIINRTAITNAERFFARKLVVKLVAPTPESIVVSKSKASDFLKWLET